MTKLDRRTFLTGTVGSTLAAPLLAPVPEAQSTATKPPNVIVMVCDDLGYGDLSCYGSPIRTPNIDRIAVSGVRFTHFNTAHPVCSVSRAAWLTGRYATRSHTRAAYFPGAKDGMDLDEKTLANILKGRNYKTMCIGKWHLGEQPEYMPTNRGFDSFFGVPYSDDMTPLPLIRDLDPVEADTNRDLLTPKYTEEAVKFIDSARGRPFFLWLAYSYPHDPARASAKFLGKSKQGIYGDAVEEIDWSVGEILTAVKRNGLEDETLIAFSSDHGPWYQGSPGILRGRKLTTYEGGTRIPFVAQWKGTIPPGRVVNAWGSNMDLVPTIAALCKARLSNNPVDGIDITNLLLGTGAEPPRGTVLYFGNTGALECARKGSWKLRITLTSAEGGPAQGPPVAATGSNAGARASQADQPEPRMLAFPELYDLANDPAESYDVARVNPAIVKEIMGEIAALIRTFPKDVVEAYQALRQNLGSPLTPPGATPRPANYVSPPNIWDPPRGD